MVDPYNVNTVAEGFLGALTLVNPAILFPELANQDQTVGRLFGAAILVLGLLSHATKDQAQTPAGKSVSKAFLLYHVLAALLSFKKFADTSMPPVLGAGIFHVITAFLFSKKI